MIRMHVVHVKPYSVPSNHTDYSSKSLSRRSLEKNAHCFTSRQSERAVNRCRPLAQLRPNRMQIRTVSIDPPYAFPVQETPWRVAPARKEKQCRSLRLHPPQCVWIRFSFSYQYGACNWHSCTQGSKQFDSCRNWFLAIANFRDCWLDFQLGGDCNCNCILLKFVWGLIQARWGFKLLKKYNLYEICSWADSL